jgi:RNA polymerase sigma-70 factor (ECF subfamily)
VKPKQRLEGGEGSGSDEPGSDHTTRMTLGDLLGGAVSTPAIAESDWVSLVQRIAAGDPCALRHLYERTHRIVFTLAVRICGRREIAEEVTVDVFHDVWRRAAEYSSDGGSVIGWVMIQARSRAIDRLRFEQRKKRKAPVELVSDREQGTENHRDAHERRRIVQHALSALSPDEREVIETAFFSELSYAETAAQLDEPVGTVKSRVRSALAKLRKLLGSDGGSS